MTFNYSRLPDLHLKRPILIYDGDCEFCRRWIARWRVKTDEIVEFQSFQDLGNRFPEIPREHFKEAIHFIDTEGHVFFGAKAIFKYMQYSAQQPWVYWLYCKLPLFAKCSEAAYRLVSKKRYLFSLFSRLMWGKTIEPSTYIFSSWLYARALGIIGMIAVISFWAQANGLIGSRGILPLPNYIEGVEDYLKSINLEGSKLFYLPTLFWINQNDIAIHTLFSAGLIASVCLTLGLCPALATFLFWLFYLSLVIAGQIFLSFQWDILLLEMSFLTIFFSSGKMRDRLRFHVDPSRLGRLLIWLLLFRLYFESGIVKFQSFGMGEINTWRDLTALNYHYWSQPLPTWTSWYFHHFPSWFHQFSLYLLYTVELGLPFLILGPRRIRNLGFLGMVLLQVAIILTGNYGFFNLLTIILCIPLIDDQSLPDFLRIKIIPSRVKNNAQLWIHNTRLVVLIPVAFIFICVGSFQLLQSCEDTRKSSKTREWLQEHEKLRDIYFWISRFHTINAYGLFRVMTTTRPEIVISGSDTGGDWKEYHFKYKPGDTLRRPSFCIPYMPRLDWQMWFAGLSYERSHTLPPWFGRFLNELFKGNTEVTNLLAINPFPENPPRYFRIQLYHYTFSDPSMREEDDRWWDALLLDNYTIEGQINEPSSS